MKIKNNNERVYSLMVGKDLEMVPEKGKIIVLYKGVIVCVTDNWIDAVDYIEQQFCE